MWLPLLFVTTALAQPLDEVRITDMVAALMPQVEQRAGRAFVHPPRARLLTRWGVREALTQPPRSVAPHVRKPSVEPISSRQQSLVESAVAIYDPNSESILVIREAVRGLRDELGVSEASLEKLLRCVMVHELVHALQHQYGVELASNQDDIARGSLALREGHATHIATSWCAEVEGPAIAHLSDATLQIDVAASIASESPMAPYAWGRLVAQALVEEDPELVWAAMAGHPPPWSAVVKGMREGLAPGWSDATPLETALTALGLTRLDPATPSSPAIFLDRLIGARAGIDPLPSGRAGLQMQALDPTRDGRAAMFLLDEPAAAVVQRRFAQADLWRDQPVYVLSPRLGTISQLRASTLPLQRRDDVQEARLATIKRHGRTYLEAWIAVDHVLAVLVFHGPRAPSRRDFRRVLQDLAASLPRTPAPGEPSSEPLEPWLAELRAERPSVEATASWQYRMHRASIAVAAGSPTACADAFLDVLEPGAVADPEPFARVAFRCAAAREERSLASRALLLTPEVDPFAAGVYAMGLLQESPAPARTVLGLLDKAGPNTDPMVSQLLSDARLYALVLLNRWSEALPLAQSNKPSAGFRAQTARILVNRGRQRVGLEILQEVCPDIDPDQADPCTPRDWVR